MTGGGLAGESLNESLAREGDLMLRALVKDLADCPGVEVVTTRDARLPVADLPARILPVGPRRDAWALWADVIGEADALWPIAPETGGALARLSELAVDKGKRLLGSTPEAVRLAASKRATAERLAACGIPAVPTGGPNRLPIAAHGWVVKPDDGAGCEETRLFESEAELRRCLAQARSPERFVVQPYRPGRSLSLCLLCSESGAHLLSVNRQHVVLEAGRFVFRGVTVGIESERRETFARLAERIAAAVPGLRGFVGIDLIDGPEGPEVLEINPRPTTSCAGLRSVLGRNPAALVLAALTDRAAESSAEPEPRAAPVEIALEPAGA